MDSFSNIDRKTTEKNRRDQMNALCSQLSSLVPHQSSTETVGLSDQLEDATNYIKKIQTRLEAMKKKKKKLLLLMGNSPSFSSSFDGSDSSSPDRVLKLQGVNVHLHGSALDVVFVTGLKRQPVMFAEAVRILYEEGADVVNASFLVVDRAVFHTLHSKTERGGLEDEASRISERLRKLVIPNTTG